MIVTLIPLIALWGLGFKVLALIGVLFWIWEFIDRYSHS